MKIQNYFKNKFLIISMGVKKAFKILLLGEIIGFLLVSSLLMLRGFGADGEGGFIYTALFWVASDMVNIAKLLREVKLFVLIFIVLICILSVYYSQKIENEGLKNKIYYLASILNGSILILILIYFLLDYAYFLGALETIPFLFGGLFLFSSISQRRFDVFSNNYSQLKNIKGFISFTIILILIIPSFSSVSGMLTKPPNEDFKGFFSEQKYNYNKKIIDFQTQEFIIENMTEISKRYDWKVHVFVPDPVPENMPLAIFLHGYEGEEEWVYIDTFESIVSNGVAVIFPQYASNYDVSKYNEDMLNYVEGGSNHPQHEWRYSMAWEGVMLGFNYLNENYNEFNSSNLWVGGHSMGSGTSVYVASKSSEMGWGQNSFIINLEAPWIYSNYEPFKGNMSFLPDHTIVNVVEYEDDVVVERCIGVWTFERLKSKDGFGKLKEENVFYLKVFSDKRGFPKLISSHYVQATPIRDSLADFAYYKRLEAQSSYLFGVANNDLDLILNSEKYFKNDGDELKNMGNWSNGIPVKKINVYKDPIGINLYGCNSK